MLSIIIESARFVLALDGVFGRVLAGTGRWLRAQHDYRALCEMRERDLRDIGLRDSELRDAGLHFADPTAIIAIRAEERRRRLAGGESVDEALRTLHTEVSGEIAEESGSGATGRIVLLRAAE